MPGYFFHILDWSGPPMFLYHCWLKVLVRIVVFFVFLSHIHFFLIAGASQHIFVLQLLCIIIIQEGNVWRIFSLLLRLPSYGSHATTFSRWEGVLLKRKFFLWSNGNSPLSLKWIDKKWMWRISSRCCYVDWVEIFNTFLYIHP